MNSPSTIGPSAAIAVNATLFQVDASLRSAGVFRYSHDYVKDREFETYILAPALQSMEAVQAFLASLDEDNQSTTWKNGCTKAQVARNFMQYPQTVTTELQWALKGLARSRRTCCGCHDTGSFNKR